MKKLLAIFLFISSLSQAQFMIEDFDDNEFFNEMSTAKLRYQFKNPVEHYRLKCTSSQYAQYPGGDDLFKQVVFKNMMTYMDNDVYAVNGTFSFIFEIGKDGKIKSFDLFPKVQNGDMLYKDLNFAMKRLQVKFKPAECNEQPIESKLRLKVDFRTENFDR